MALVNETLKQKEKKMRLFTSHDCIYLSKLARICCMDFFTDCDDAKKVNLANNNNDNIQYTNNK